jgi:threonine dehydratase
MSEASLEGIRAAAARIAGAVERTPFLRSRTLSRLAGCELWLKFENLQFTASFKERGALNKLLTMTAAERARGVIAMSAGNHAQGVAYHAARLGVRAVIVMPRGTPNNKVTSTRVHGAEVVLEGETLSQAADHARARAARDGFTFIHPYDDVAVICGQGTVGLEMMQDVPELDALVVPVGGGGLVSGIALAAKALRPGIRVYGVESKTWSAMYQRLHGLPVDVGGDTLAEGIAVRDVSELTLALCRKHVDEMLLVDEAAIERALVALIEIEKTVAEGAGAAGLAAVLAEPQRFAGLRVGMPICGGNIDSRVLAAVLMRGLVRDGRLVRMRVTMPDVSGSLAKAAALIGEAGGNIVEVYHQRLFHDVPLKMAELDIVVETRDAEHVDGIIRQLKNKGMAATLLSTVTG